MATKLSSLLIWIVMLSLLGIGNALPEQGVWVTDMDNMHNIQAFSKTMYKGTQISVSITCESEEDIDFQAKWILRRSPCAGEFRVITTPRIAEIYLSLPEKGLSWEGVPYSEVQYIYRPDEHLHCSSNGHASLEPIPDKTKPSVIRKLPTQPQTQVTTVKGNKTENHPAVSSPAEGKNTEAGKKRMKRSSGDETEPGSSKTDDKSKDKTPVKNNDKPLAGTDEKSGTVVVAPSTSSIPDKDKGSDSSKLDQETVVKVWEDGYYVFILRFDDLKETDKLQVTVRMSLDDSYISAGDKPLLIFYGVMGLVYVFYAIFWLVMLACNWKDLLRVQFWISAVILLGMLEKAVFFGEYENVNKTGSSVYGAVIFAELVSCVKRTLARMLVIIVSLGYGIVKPRLGQTFHKVLIVGGIFFILASIESCLRASGDKADQSRPQMIASVPLAITEAIICYWIFTSLLQTTRTLRLRRNVVKLSLYRHFTNTLIFCIIASIAYMVWFTTQHRFVDCITDWKELWMDEAFWHFLFSVILFIIMVLWRPTANNQRYAFSPLLDAAEDDIDDDVALTEAYDGMKMRTTKTQQRNGSANVKEEQKMEDDLKWVEENIPSSIVDKVLPALDSDEEIMNTKFEASKME